MVHSTLLQRAEQHNRNKSLVVPIAEAESRHFRNRNDCGTKMQMPIAFHWRCESRHLHCNIFGALQLRFSMWQRGRAALLKMGVPHLNSRQNGGVSKVNLPWLSGALHRSVTTTLSRVALHWATRPAFCQSETSERVPLWWPLGRCNTGPRMLYHIMGLQSDNNSLTEITL